MKRIIPAILGLFVFFSLALPAEASIPVQEGNLAVGGIAYEVNPDSDGWLWISEYGKNEVWRLNPQTGAYSIYSTGGSPADARRDGSYFWWVDASVNQISRAEVVDGNLDGKVAFSTWEVPDARWFWGTTLDSSGRLWTSDGSLSQFYRIALNAAGTEAEICTYSTPMSGLTNYLAYDDPYLWLADDIAPRLLRLNVNDNTYQWFQLPPGSYPFGMAVDGEGDIWYAETLFSALSEFDPESKVLLQYQIPSIITPLDSSPVFLSVQQKSIWYSEDYYGSFGLLDTTIAGYEAYELSTGNGTLAPICATGVLPYNSGSMSITNPKQNFTWSAPINYVPLVDAGGWKIYTDPSEGATPNYWGIAYKEGKTWVVDDGQQKLLQIDAPANSADLTLKMTAAPTNFDSLDDVISYLVDLTNTGSVSLSGPFSVSSNIAIDSNCPSEPASLTPGSKITCTATYTITQADLDAGSVLNIAQGNGFLGTEQIISNLDSSSVGAIQGPALTLVKTALQTTYGSAGEVIFYNFELTNTGNVTLEAPFTITDDKATDEVCPGELTSLAPGASLTCAASYTIAPEDISAGEVINVATGHGFFGTAPVDSNSDTETVTFMPNPSLTLEKSATPTTYETVSDVISYSFLLTNTGNVTLEAPFTITDDKTTNESCPGTPTSLAPGASITCTASYTITLEDISAGEVINIATGHGFSGMTPVNSNSDTKTVTYLTNPALTLEKSAFPTTYIAVDDVIGYSFLLTNSGNVTLTAPFTVADSKATDESCPGTPASLAPGAKITCTASYTITQADLNAGSVTNTAQGQGFFGTTAVNSNSDSETVTAVQNPALTLVKTATPETYDSVGDVIAYSFHLTNSGNVTLIGPITVTDNKATDESCPGTPASLAPGASITCTASYTITQADLNAGSVMNTAQGHGFFGATAVHSNEDSETVTAVQNPALTLVKTATPTIFTAVGNVINYSFLVTNTGNVTLEAPFTIIDDKATDESCPSEPTILAPGASLTCTASYTITGEDINAGSVTNNATGHGHLGVVEVDSNQDSATVNYVPPPEYKVFLPLILR